MKFVRGLSRAYMCLEYAVGIQMFVQLHVIEALLQQMWMSYQPPQMEFACGGLA